MAAHRRLWLFLGCLAVFAWNVATIWPYTVDDAFIYYRYAEHIATGHGPNFNAGERAEGGTAMVWMFVLAAFAWCGVSVPLVAKCLGVAAMVATIGLLCRIGKDEAGGSGWVAAILPAAFFASWPGTAVHAVSGMETGLFTFQVVLHLALCVRFVDSLSKGLTILLPLSALLLGLQRPDGNVIGVVSLGLTALVVRDRLLFNRALLFYVLPGAIYFVARWVYYGHVLPLPMYVKMFGGLALDDATLDGSYQAGDFASIWGAWLGLPFLLGCRDVTRRFWPAAAATLAFVGVVFLPKHIMGFEYRYFFPALPAFLTLGGLGMARAARLLPVGFIALLSLVTLVPNVTTRDARYSGLLAYEQAHTKVHVALGQHLATYDGEAPTLLMGDAGATPYFSRWPTIDSYGLCDPATATKGHDADALLARGPDLVVLISKSGTAFDPWLPWEGDIRRAALAQGFETLHRLEYDRTYHLWLLARPGSTVHSWLSNWSPGR